MNYYEHHIRDYDADTSHLTWDQDLAYTRLLRWYYRKERPIPADVKEACRLVRAMTKVQRAAVAAVLDEFFELREDGWHQETCDRVIGEFVSGEPERELKKANEDNRTKRHREERAKLFRIITDAGQHAPWNTPMSELREMVNALHTPEPVTASATPDTQTDTKPVTAATQPVTAPATPVTATQTPIPSTHIPEVNGSSISTDGGCASALDLPPAAALADALREAEIEADPGDERLQRWADEGASPADVVKAIGEAQARRRKAGSTQPVNVGLVDVILADILAKRAAPSAVTPGTAPPWWESASGITSHGAMLSVHQQADEPFPYFKARVFEAAGDGPWAWKARGAVTVSGPIGERH